MDTLHTQLRGMSDSIKAISDHAANYSDKVNHDLEAVNDQLNVVFNLFIDKIDNLDNINDEKSFYSDVSDEEIETATTGRVDNSTNKGIVQGDINVGGIAGSMAIDEEDPEDNAAGSTDFSLGAPTLQADLRLLHGKYRLLQSAPFFPVPSGCLLIYQQMWSCLHHLRQ